MKKIFSFFTAFIIMLSLFACSAKPETALTIEKTAIGEEIYAYFLDKVVSNPENYSLKKNSSEKDLCAAATRACKIYAAINTEFRNLGLTLSAAEKAEISETVNNIWIRSENHYKSIGISKQALTKAKTSEAYEKAIFSAKYDKGIGNATAEAQIKKYFYSNYITFHTVCAYFTSSDGSTPLTQLQKNELVALFNTFASEKTTDAEFADMLAASGYTSSGSVLLKKGSDGYPAGFYEKVDAQAVGSVQIIEFEDCIFAVYKESLEEKGDGLYSSFRSACINDLYSLEHEMYIDSLISEYKTNENNSVISDIYDRITK